MNDIGFRERSPVDLGFKQQGFGAPDNNLVPQIAANRETHVSITMSAFGSYLDR